MRRIAGFLFAILLGSNSFGQSIHGRDGITLPPPPAAESEPVIDNYFGTKVTDNYRWLEDAKELRNPQAFIDEENAYTTRYLKQNRIRNQVQDDLDPLEHTSRWSHPHPARRQLLLHEAPRRRGAGLHLHAPRLDRRRVERSAQPPKDERLIDPAALSRDPNTSVRLADVSRDGMLLAYQVRQGGADEATVRIFSVAKKKPLEDELPAAHLLLHHFHTRRQRHLLHAHRPQRHAALSARHRHAHRLDDKLIFGREFHGELLGPIDLFRAEITDDAHYLVVTIERGVPARRVDICFRDLTKPGSPFEVLVWALDSRFSTIYARSAWYVRTDYNSPNGRILRADPGIMPEAWKTIVPEGKDVIENVLHRRRKNLRQAPSRREVRNQRLHPRRQTRRHR